MLVTQTSYLCSFSYAQSSGQGDRLSPWIPSSVGVHVCGHHPLLFSVNNTLFLLLDVDFQGVQICIMWHWFHWQIKNKGTSKHITQHKWHLRLGDLSESSDNDMSESEWLFVLSFATSSSELLLLLLLLLWHLFFFRTPGGRWDSSSSSSCTEITFVWLVLASVTTMLGPPDFNDSNVCLSEELGGLEMSIDFSKLSHSDWREPVESTADLPLETC